MNKKEVEKEVRRFESSDRYIARQMLMEMFTEYNNNNFNIYYCPIECNYDLSGATSNFNGIREDFIAEVKENTTNEKYLPCRAIIKEKKVNDIFDLSNNRDMYFISLKDGKIGYIFYMNRLEWDRMFKFDMPQKVAQVDKDSKWKKLPTYLIDYDKAVWSCDVTKYYKEYADYKQAKEKKQLS